MRGVLALGDKPATRSAPHSAASPSMNGLDLATAATIPQRVHGRTRARQTSRRRVRFRDETQTSCGCSCSTAAASPSSRRRRTAAETRALKPDGVFLSNGPGDPAAVGYAIDTIRTLADGKLPIFGICLGHQLLGLAMGGETVKLPYGHRGATIRCRILRHGKYLSRHRIMDSQFGERRLAFPARSRLRSPTLTSTTGPSKESSIGSTRFLPFSTSRGLPGPHDAQGHFQQFLQALDTNK